MAGKVRRVERSEEYILKESGITALIFKTCSVIQFQDRHPTLRERKHLGQEVKSYDWPFKGLQICTIYFVDYHAVLPLKRHVILLVLVCIL